MLELAKPHKQLICRETRLEIYLRKIYSKILFIVLCVNPRFALHSHVVDGKGTVGFIVGEVCLTIGVDDVLEGFAISETVWENGDTKVKPTFASVAE